MRNMRKLIYPIVLPLSVALTACTTIMENIPGVYTLDIQQGNVINQDMVDQLKPGMTKRQVLYVMGSSMLVDVFHEKRWDYLYSEQLGGESRKQKKVSLFFNDEKLVAIQGDFRPSIVPVAKKSNETTVDVPPRELDKTLGEKITSIFDDEPPVKQNKVKKAHELKKERAVKKFKEAKAVDKVETQEEDNSLWGSMTSAFSSDEVEEETVDEKIEKLKESDNSSSHKKGTPGWGIFSNDDAEKEVESKAEEVKDLDEVLTSKEEDSSIWDSMTSVFSSDDSEESKVEKVEESKEVKEISTQKKEKSMWDSMTSVFSSDDAEQVEESVSE